MHVNPQALVDGLHKLGDLERQVVAHFVARRPAARDPNVTFEEKLTFGDRLADRVATFGGSWRFIFLFLAAMTVWMLVNARSAAPFDAYPFILLNLVLSCVAALQAPVIMMSQNRQGAKDRHDAQSDYQVNLKAEMEIASLHLKLDELRERRWEKLAALAQRQLEILERIESRIAR